MMYIQCALAGEDPFTSLLTIEIDEGALVGALQEKVRRRKSLNHLLDIGLWKLHEPVAAIDIRDGKVDIRDLSKIAILMDPTRFLSDYDLEPKGTGARKIPIVVATPEASTELPTATALLQERKRYIENDLPKKAPSSAAIPSEFWRYQERKQFPFLCNRPHSTAAPLPTTLLHQVFGRFVDLCTTHKPTAEDNQLALELSIDMSQFYGQEASRAHQFRSSLAKYGIDVHDSSVALCYYGSFLKQFSQSWQHRSVLPCFHIILFGPCIAFSGAVFTDKIYSDILGPILPLFAHSADRAIHELTARTFGALRIAFNELRDYYLVLASKPTMLDPDVRHFRPDCPYRNYYLDELQQKRYFIYNGGQPDSTKRIFYAKTQDDKEICLKFVRHYSPDAHRLCAERGHAPKLLAYESLPGGWNMVVMEALDISDINPPSTSLLNSYHQFTYYRDAIRNPQPLRNAIVALIEDLHQNGYVHGDLRDVKFFIRNDPNRHGDFMLLDFDWAGKTNEARYPMYVNRRRVQRPAGAVDGERILPEHDLEMVDYMFGQAPAIHPADVGMTPDG